MSRMPLGHIDVAERDDVIATIFRMPRRFLPWDVWVVVKTRTDREKWGEDDPTRGIWNAWKVVRAGERFYNTNITHYGRLMCTARNEESARRKAEKYLDRFLKKRAKHEAIAAQLKEHECES